MYVRDPQLEGFSETLAKVRKAVHKIFPRELSPTRLAEKYGADAKKKGAARLAKVAAISAEHSTAADAALTSQIALLDAALPDEIAADFPAPAAPKKTALPAWAPWAVGGAFAAAAILLYKGRRR